MSKQPWPQPGEVWADADPRMTGRTMKILDITMGVVTFEVLTDRPNIVKPMTGREFTARIERFIDGEYTRLSVPDTAAPPS